MASPGEKVDLFFFSSRKKCNFILNNLEDPKDKWWSHKREGNDRTAIFDIGYGDACLCRRKQGNAGQLGITQESKIKI